MFVSVMPANHKKQAQKAARCGVCKNCVRYGTKKKCLNPKREQQESLVSAAAAFSSPVTRRRPAGRGVAVSSSSVDVDSQWTPAPKDSTPEYTPAPLRQRPETRKQQADKRAEKNKKKQKKEAALLAAGVGAAAAAAKDDPTLLKNDDPAAWLVAAGIILPTKVDDEQSTIEKQSPIQESTVEKQNMELEKAAKKANVLAFMMNKQEQKNVLCPATLHAHGVIYLSLNFHHISHM